MCPVYSVTHVPGSDRQQIPLMVIPYIGALKSWMMKAVIGVFGPSVVAIRLPGVTLGTVTIYLFSLLLRRICGREAALVGTALLATDPVFGMTTKWDWGPVVLQHLLLVGALYQVAAFVDTRRPGRLGLAGVLLGLAVWDKAVFVWMLGGLVVSTVVVLRRRLMPFLKPLYLAMALGGFLLGASPLVVYNLRNDWVTFRSNSKLSADDVAGKARLLWSTLEGASMSGVVARAAGDGPERAVESSDERAVTKFAKLTGEPRSTWQGYLFLAGLASGSVVAVWGGVWMLVSWLAMALTVGAGGGVHHVVLLWPLPQMVIAAGIASTLMVKHPVWRMVMVVGAMGVAAQGIAVSLTHRSDEVRFGTQVAWSDALHVLPQAIGATERKRVCVADWGFYDSLKLMGGGRIELCQVNATEQANEALAAMRSGNTVFVGHTEENRFLPEMNAGLERLARQERLRKVIGRTLRDRNGREMIELFWFEPRE
jgi:4-amino-4-deoxy-L-arabinose transferase-like glycosyltransferase